jgi:hypothetical protein
VQAAENPSRKAEFIAASTPGTRAASASLKPTESDACPSVPSSTLPASSSSRRSAYSEANSEPTTATRELGGTLGVAVVGSLFSFQYGERVVSLLGDKVDATSSAQAADSVGFAHVLSQRVPGLERAVDAAFLDGFGMACTVVGVLCLVGALIAFVSLPGDRYDPLAEADLVAVPSGGDESIR